ncbi:phage holin family protein [Arcanobacterium phocae]|uniref:phage holin family protein n=1 Tax=Arcanobacterium phocae TaxID=131112 RepID=UPI0027DEBDFF|nr:phage holin family protein [Arcanobacterium phocae]
MATEHTNQINMVESSTPSSGGSIGELIAKITSQFSALVRDEIKYTGLQAKAKVTRLGIGGVLLAVAGILALYMLGFLFTGIAWAFAIILPIWAGYLITAGILLVIILILALVGKKSIDKASQATVNPKAGLVKNVEAIKKGFEK